jgi:hypothetical protein
MNFEEQQEQAQKQWNTSINRFLISAVQNHHH